MDKLYIVIPAYNEAANIEAVARQWHAIAAQTGTDSRLLIIDDGSTDGTHKQLLALKAELPQLQVLSKENGGHGQAILFGYRQALLDHADYVFQTDSDGQTLSTEFAPFWDGRKSYDAQIGHRVKRQDGFSRVVVTGVLRLVLLIQFGMWITDANTPFRLMSADSLARFLPTLSADCCMTNVLLSVLYHKGGTKIIYRPITFRPRQGGENSLNFIKIVKSACAVIKEFAAAKKLMKTLSVKL